MNTTTFTTGDVIKFESGTVYQVLGFEDDRLVARALRNDQLFGSRRLLDPARCKLIRHAATAPEAPQLDAPEALPEPAPTTGSIPRVTYWDAITRAEANLHNAIQAARLGGEAKDAVDRIVSALAEGARPDPDDFAPIRDFVDHVDGNQ
jgi:hypothetical protein